MAGSKQVRYANGGGTSAKREKVEMNTKTKKEASKKEHQLMPLTDEEPTQRHFCNKDRAQKNLWLATSNERRHKNPFHRSGQTVAVCRGLGPPELTGWTGLDHHDSNPPLHFFCATAPNQTIAGPESKKTTHAHPNRYDCRGHTSHLLLTRICFAPCITGVLVADLT